jgi:exopolysaccharide production protein ExoZ
MGLVKSYSASANSQPQRIIGLDYLRGLCAVLVMLYHYRFEFYGRYPASDFLSRMGIYAVGMFFILSGVSLTVTYRSRLNSITDVVEFFARRFFRLSPLYSFLIFSTMFIGYLEAQSAGTQWARPRVIEILANVSLLFGLFRQPYLLGGGWSLGVEVVYYLMFPIVLWLNRARRSWSSFMICGAFLVSSIMSWRLLSARISLDDQWNSYINPVINVPLFLAGVMLGLYVDQLKNIRLLGLCFVFGICIFVFYPSGREAITLVTGINRLVFSIGAILVVVGALTPLIRVPKSLHTILDWLGGITYSLYLIHQIVLGYVIRICSNGNVATEVQFFVSVISSLILSVLTLNVVERPCQVVGNRLLRFVMSKASSVGT